MNEFVNQPFETRQSYEIDDLVKRAKSVLPPENPESNTTTMSWVNHDERGALYLELGIGPVSGELEGKWLCASESRAISGTDLLDVIKYYVNVDHRVFLTRCDRYDTTDPHAQDEDSDDLIKMRMSLGLLKPQENDWDRIYWIVEKANEFKNAQRGADIAHMTHSLKNLIDNHDELS